MFIKNKIINRLSALLFYIAGASLLVGCGSQESTETITDDSDNVAKEEQIKDVPIVDQDTSEEKLIVDSHRCIGCGKCARVAPENFKMSGRKAIVVSEEKSGATTQAIKICPVNAISA